MPLYGEPVIGDRVGGTIQCGDQFIIDFHAGDPRALRNRMIGHRRSGCHQMLDGIFLRPIRGKRGGNDTTLGMADQRHGLILADACLTHRLGNHASAVRFPAALLIGAHQFHVLRPAKW